MKEDIGVSLECRDISHSWNRAGDAVILQQEGQVRHFSRILECDRCGCRRTDEYKISRVTIVRVRSKYEYPDGYQIKGGLSKERARWLMFRDAEMEPAPVAETA